MSVEEIVAVVEKQRPYFREKGGITVSGGEPLIQRKELIPLFTELKKRGIHTALDTNGSQFDDDTKRLLELTDLILLDIKHVDSDQHKVVTGQSNTVPLEFARYLEEIHKPFWIRYVLVPGYTDQTEAMEQLGKHFHHYTSLERVEILPYHKLGVYKYEGLGMEYKLKGVEMPSEESIEQCRKVFKKYFEKVVVR